MKILFVGCGNMGQAIARGMLDSKNFAATEIDVVLPNASNSLGTVQKSLGCKIYLNPPLKNYDVIIFAVKPQTIAAIVEQYAQIYGTQGNCLILSIIASKTVSFFKEYFPNNKIVRTMPNLNCQVKLGSTVGCASEKLGPDAVNLIERIFSSIGSYTWVEETLIDPISAISGSGPAYYYLFTECLAQAAINLGVEEVLANTLAQETFIGSAVVASQSQLNLSELRKAVTSHKGTTEDAISVFKKDNNLIKLIANAMNAAIARAKELKK